jgi:hypothetical protein
MKINFKTFCENSKGVHGEYVNDIVEKTMVNEIIKLLFNNEKHEKNYDTVYSFIEWDGAKDFYDEYYDAFKEYAEFYRAKKLKHDLKPLSPTIITRIAQFRKEVGPLFNKWKATIK